MKSLNAFAAAFGLVATLASSPVLADATPLFIFDSQPLFAPPGFGTSIGTVAVDDGSLTGLPPVSPRTRQLLIDSQGVGRYDQILGAFSIAVPGSLSMSAFQYGFSVAATTTFQFAYNFLTNTDPADPATFEVFTADLFNSGGSEIADLAFESTGISTFSLSPTFYGFETGTKYVEFTVGPGSYTAQFLVVSDQTGCIRGLGVCIPTGAVLNSVPEPATLALAGLALLATVASRRRRG